MSRRNRMRAESGTCNVCFAPCSSCMHLNLALMGSKTDEFSDETCRETTGSQYSNNESDGLHSCKGRPCDSLQHTASEASNLLSVNSSHDSFSVNAESKAAIRSSDRSAASEDFEMHIELLSSAAGAMAQLSPKPETGVDQRISLIKYEDPKGVEGLDDNISCVSRANDTNVAVTAVSDHDRSVDIKNLSHSSASVCSLGADGLGKTPSSQKLELSEIPLLKKVDASGGSPKGRSPVSQSQGDKCLIEGSSEAFTKVHPKSEVETDKDIGDPPDEAFKRSVQDKQDLKSTQLAEFPDMQPLQATSGDETDESDIVEHDVKVCDICGDAGREDLLAICSRCSDGAEHTYCMREMLQKIPEGDWLCEECKFAEETEKQKQGLDLEGKRTNKISASTQSSGKRQTENLEAAPAAKRQAIETSLGSPKSLSPGRTATLSRDSSFKGVDKGKVRSVSFGNHSSNDVVENTCPSKGTLLKSRSFSTLNSKAKVKLVDEVVHPKQKGTREQASFDIKEGITRVMSKSMSFKSANSVRSSAGESKVQMLSPRSSRVHDLKGLKQVKERNAFERKNLSRLDRSVPGSSMAPSAVSTAKVDLKLMPRGESISISSASNNRESKVVKAEGKGITLSKSNSNLGRQGVEVPVTPVGAFCMSGVCSSSVEHKPNLVSPKDEPSSSSSWTAEKPSTNVNEILQDALPRALESTNQGEKTSSSRPRSTITAGPKGVLCQKCREFGHEVESCPLGSPHVSGVDVSARRNSREDVIGGNKLKAALEAANKLPVTYGRNRVNDQSDGLCTTNIDLNCERASQDQLSVSNKRTYEVQTNKQTSMNHLKPFSAHSTDVVSPLRVGDSISTVPSFGKAGIRDLPGQALADISALKKISAIPEHEYIWQGGFEVHRQGKFLDLCGGIQAHLSSCASPKVLEIVNKFPQRIHLNEVPRLSTWPTMFHESGAEEDNIALYFFAKDLESYERIYKGLVDSMIKKDLALKGNLDSIELLIFPSNQLPETCQRWNMLFFLWGVFRVRRVSCSNSSKNSCTTGSNMVPLNPVTSTERTSVCQNLDLLTQTDKDSAARNSSHNMALGSYGPDKSCIAINGNCDKKVSSVQQASLGFQPNSEQQDGRLDSGLALRAATTMSLLSTEISSSPSLEECDLSERGQDTEVKTCQAIRNSIGSSKGGMMEMNGGTSFGENSSSIRNLPVGNHDVGEDRSVQAEKVPVIMKRSRNEINLERDMNDDSYLDAEIALEDLNSKGMGHQQSNHQSCPDLDLRETSQNSSGTSKRMQWNETFVDGESSSKKPKTVFSGAYECSSSIDRDYGDGFSSQIDDLGPSSSVAKRCEGLSDKKVLPNDLGAERYFFPVDSQRAEDFRLGANSVPWKVLSSKHEDQYLDGVPNLELALGAETKQPNKGMLPFFVGPLDKNNNQDKPPDKEGEEDVSASLSLSLSFPSSDKEQTSVKPASKSEQLMPERRHVNTSLILFGGFLDK